MKRSSYHLPAPSSKEQVSSLQTVNKITKDRKILLVLTGCIIGTVLSANLCLSDVLPFSDDEPELQVVAAVTVASMLGD
jgi:hypothetical protein